MTRESKRERGRDREGERERVLVPTVAINFYELMTFYTTTSTAGPCVFCGYPGFHVSIPNNMLVLGFDSACQRST